MLTEVKPIENKKNPQSFHGGALPLPKLLDYADE